MNAVWRDGEVGCLNSLPRGANLHTQSHVVCNLCGVQQSCREVGLAQQALDGHLEAGCTRLPTMQIETQVLDI